MAISFGDCCKDLGDAFLQPPNSFFRIEENGVLYLTVGYVETEQGLGFFETAVMFCPFCGKQLQTREEVQDKADGFCPSSDQLARRGRPQTPHEKIETYFGR